MRHPIKNTRELAARLLEAALIADRGKIMADGLPLHEHDIWRLLNTIVGDIRTNKKVSVGGGARYRFKPYELEDVPGLKAAMIACSSDYDRMSGRDYNKIADAAEAALPVETVLQVTLDAWMQERGQWVMASYEGMSREQKEAVRACVDAREIRAAVRLFMAISGTRIGDVYIDELADHSENVLTVREMRTMFNKTAPAPAGNRYRKIRGK